MKPSSLSPSSSSLGKISLSLVHSLSIKSSKESSIWTISSPLPIIFIKTDQLSIPVFRISSLTFTSLFFNSFNSVFESAATMYQLLLLISSLNCDLSHPQYPMNVKKSVAFACPSFTRLRAPSSDVILISFIITSDSSSSGLSGSECKQIISGSSSAMPLTSPPNQAFHWLYELLSSRGVPSALTKSSSDSKRFEGLFKMIPLVNRPSLCSKTKMMDL
mmetsp:Transcript_27191/g.40187  ORF Transcript_27191/g.40187 Transcript_27191/m.40187 type:complete len:218 (-) Transcript_27191:549-1202(-)